MSGSEPKSLGRVGLSGATSSIAVAGLNWNNYSGENMRAIVVASFLRLGLLAGAAFLFLFLWFGTGAERSPIGLMIGMTVAGLVGLWWLESQIRNALEKAKEVES